MRFSVTVLVFLFLATVAWVPAARGTDFYFEPDTVWAETGETVLFSGRITDSPVLRGFTIYMAYDTNRIDLAEPPTPGALIAGHSGLQFNYFDHPFFEPEVLEIGGTIYGSDLWQGPGELFQVRFTVRECGYAPITAPFSPFFVDGQGGYPTVSYLPALVVVCPGQPRAPEQLTLWGTATSVTLHWRSVTQDVVGRTLGAPPFYRILRREVLPAPQPYQIVATIPDTVFSDAANPGIEYFYQVIATTTP